VIAAAVMFLFMVYSLGIKKTVAQYKECKGLEDKVRLATSAPADLVEVERKYSAMQKLMESYNAGTNIQQALLGVASKYCNENNVVLKDFPKPIISSEKDLTIETNQFVVEGDFTKLLRLLYNLEQRNKLGRIASANFFLRKDYSSKTNNLMASIYIQNIKKAENEK
jgi:hypothetical protein